jgi:hypothetical protein
MMPPDLSGGNCRKFAPEELERTFFYPGPMAVAKPPAKRSLRAWDQAKEVCIECPIFLACREANWGQDYGVWGGTDQHERHLYRRRLTKLLGLKDPEERAALAAHFHARHGSGLGESPDLIARQTGYSVVSIRILIAEHEEALEADRLRREVAKGGEPRWIDRPRWPKGPPTNGDGWVWCYGHVYVGHYVAQTADGAYLYMRIKPGRAQTLKWIRKAHVDMRTTVAPVVQDWVGRPHGIQEKAQDDQRSGKQAAGAA